MSVDTPPLPQSIERTIFDPESLLNATWLRHLLTLDIIKRGAFQILDLTPIGGVFATMAASATFDSGYIGPDLKSGEEWDLLSVQVIEQNQIDANDVVAWTFQTRDGSVVSHAGASIGFNMPTPAHLHGFGYCWPVVGTIAKFQVIPSRPPILYTRNNNVNRGGVAIVAHIGTTATVGTRSFNGPFLTVFKRSQVR
jgi:hypothetical protein